MTLTNINKTRYRKHLKVVFFFIVLVLTVISLSSSTLFIYLFSTPDVSNFYHNLAGVAFSAVIVFILLKKMRQHTYLYEVVYVWDLKQHLNRIQRKSHKIEVAVESNNVDAMIIMNFMYLGSKQLYELDDNTITMGDLLRKIAALEQHIKESGLDLATTAYDPSMLDQF